MSATTPFRSLREGLNLTLREVSRRSKINPGRLSIIERGVTPSEQERATLMRVLLAAILPEEATDGQGPVTSGEAPL